MRVWIRDAAGRLHDGVNIQGSGGIVMGASSEIRIRLAIERATQDKPTGFLEPERGHVLGYFRKWWGNADTRVIDLRGAELVRVADEPLPPIAPPA